MVDFCLDCLVCIVGGFMVFDENYGGIVLILIGGILRFFYFMFIVVLLFNVLNYL